MSSRPLVDPAQLPNWDDCAERTHARVHCCGEHRLPAVQHGNLKLGTPNCSSPERRPRAVKARLPVLMYHSAPESGPGSRLAVPRRLIDRQWRALCSDGWILRGLTEALDLSRADPKARIVGVTFDDGYSDFLGVPDLLSKHDAHATLYLPTSHPDIAERGGPWLSWPEAVSSSERVG